MFALMGKWAGIGRTAFTASQGVRRALVTTLVALAGALTGLLATAMPAAAIRLPAGFQEDVVFSGLTQPTAVSFAKDGRIFVAEKSGLIKMYTSLEDTSPDIVADLRTEVHDYWDRGLLGMALDPNFRRTTRSTFSTRPARRSADWRRCSTIRAPIPPATAASSADACRS
jgi:glucose/arabinose dehydrogenase